MSKYKRKGFNPNLFQAGKYQQFRKGDVYRDPRITSKHGERDFLVIDNEDGDFEFLEKYLANELDNHVSEEYNVFTTGVDKNDVPMIGLYWQGKDMEMVKKAIVLCRGGSEGVVLDIVDRFCEVAEPYDEEVGEAVVVRTGNGLGTLGLNAYKKK